MSDEERAESGAGDCAEGGAGTAGGDSRVAWQRRAFLAALVSLATGIVVLKTRMLSGAGMFRRPRLCDARVAGSTSLAGAATSPPAAPEVGTPAPAVPGLGLNAPLGQTRLLANSEWYRDISGAPVHRDSASYLAALGKQIYSQDAGGWTYGGATVGIPYFVVAGKEQPYVAVVCGQYLSESDISYAPIPLRDDIVEGFPKNTLFPGTPSDSDRHVVVVDRDHRVIYELYRAYLRRDHWYCSNMAVWDMDSGDLQRPTGETSADVGGLSVMAGLILGHQVSADSIDHAFRFTIQHQCPNYFSPPAAHASSYGNERALPFGGRLRLKASVSETRKPGGGPWNITALRIVRTLKKFGMINADTGLALSSQGDTSRWDNGGQTGGPAWQDLRELRTDDFEVVDTGAAIHAQSNTARNGAAPVATLRASAIEVAAEQPVTLTPEWTGKGLARLTPAGHVLRTPGPIVDRPSRDSWYLLEVVNRFGRTRVLKRVIVTNGSRRYARYDRYVGPAGSLSNDGLSPGSAWPLEVLNSDTHRHLVAGYVIGVLDGTYDVSKMKSSDYDIPLLQIPSGTIGRPTVLQAVNSRQAKLAGGSNTSAIMGSRYQGLSHIQIIGLHFFAPSAPHATYFTGDGGFLIDDCEFAGFGVSAIRASRVAVPLVRGNRVHNLSTSWLMLLDACSDVRMRANKLDVAGREWKDYGGDNSAIVVD
jgi:hypothetical protein